MRDFDFDVKEKKEIARGAFHRVSTTERHGCSLPSDTLTPAQQRKLNGPVVSVRMGQPTTWEEFKGIESDDLKREYIRDLIDTYSATGVDLAEMFGVCSATVGRVLQKLGIDLKRAGRVSEKHKEIWSAFCNGVVGGQPTEIGSGETAEEEIPEELLSAHEQAFTDTLRETPSIQSASMTVTYDHVPGDVDIANLLDLLKLTGGGDHWVRVAIEVLPQHEI